MLMSSHQNTEQNGYLFMSVLKCW